MRIRTIVPIAALSLAAVAAAPAVTLVDEDTTTETAPEGTTEEAPEPLICEVPSYATPLTLDGFSELITAPDALLGSSDKTTLHFTLDLGTEEAPAYADTTGRVSADLTWTVALNDYDLSVNGSLSENYQPIDPASESATVTVKHCALVTVSAIDFLAPAAVEELQLDIAVTRTS